MFSDPATNLAKLGLTDGMKVGDIGAGSGFYSIEAARRVGSSGRVFAIDIQKDLLERMRNAALGQRLNNIEVVWANAEKIGGTKLRESSLDRVVASNILFQLEKPEDFALEMKRILKPGGKILIVDWSEVSALGPKNLFPQMKAETMFAKNGFALEQSFNAGDHHYGLVLTRS